MIIKKMNRIFLFSLFAMLLIVAGTANAENVTFNTRSWSEETKKW